MKSLNFLIKLRFMTGNFKLRNGARRASITFDNGKVQALQSFLRAALHQNFRCVKNTPQFR
jgi:hypothetical protein